ncbi:CIA30 family protein [Roseibacillus persicicus]|uniref:CIA30 family protein n=2 Tax=Roseibacillus persicicus TaxID=454148 RepID=A0A918WFQ0_9BACT|nr:CIA30 family protein [Roseibacillus persicicus]
MAFASTSLFAETEKEDSRSSFVLQFEDTQSEPRWQAVNDGVMGGLSEGKGVMEDGILHFTGVLSLENNGGFASVRTNDLQSDFSGADGIALKVKGDGRTYQLRLATNAPRISYQAEFETREGEWIEVQVPFSEMKPSWRGRMLSGPELDRSKVTQLGILLGDKKPGSFALEVDWLETYLTSGDS